MIAELDKNAVYLADPVRVQYLTNRAEFAGFYDTLVEAICPRAQVRLFGSRTVRGLAPTHAALPEIWLRDFAPVKTTDVRMVMFRCEPSYMAQREYSGVQEALLRALGMEFSVERADLTIDGS